MSPSIFSSSIATFVEFLGEQTRLLRSRPPQLLHCVADVRPLDDEAVVGLRLIRPLLALTHRIEPIGQVTSNLTVRSHVIEDGRRARITMLLQCPYQPLRNLPDRETPHRGRIQVAGKFISTQQPHLTALSPQDARFDK